MLKTNFRDYIQWRQRWPDSLTLLSILGIDLFEPTPEQIRRWVDLNKGRFYRYQDDQGGKD
jgi:hypothetical protein